MSRGHSIVITTYSKEKTGAKIIEALLAARLAACVQVLPIRSSYSWKARVRRGREKLMLIKSKSKHFKEIKRVILEKHDYEVPEIVSVRIAQGLAGYLAWVDKVTK